MTKAQQTRLFILEQTAPLFNKKGFDATSLSDLTKATGLSKGAIYGNFADKEEIAREAFRHSMRKVHQLLTEKLAREKSCKGQLQSLLDFYSEYVLNPPVEGGCPLLNTAVESDDHHVSMRKVVVEELTHSIDFITLLIEKGIKNGEFKKSNARHLAFIIFCSIEGALMFSRVEGSKNSMDIVVRHCKNMLDQISK